MARRIADAARRPRGAGRTALAALLAAACGSTTEPPVARNLERPADLAFACYGQLAIDGAAPVLSPQPLASCAARARGDVPPRQEAAAAPGLYGFALESARGTLAIVNADPAIGAVVDSDPLTPGRNSIPIGTLPVGITPDGSGCHLITANAGSCDLSQIEVAAAIEPTIPTEVVHRAITTPAGTQILARPGAVVGAPQTTEIGAACPAAASGMIYVAYPACGLVAAVDATTGVIQGGVTFGEDGSATISDGEVSCAVECGDEALVARRGEAVDAGPEPDGGPTVTGLGRPFAVTVGPDGKLYVGADNQPRLAIVTLDGAGLPTAIESVRLEGDVGVRRIAVSDEVAVGGEGSEPSGGAPARYAYLVATDATVRVVDLTQGVECDAQVDPRGLRDVTDPARLACLPVGGPDTPPRRAGFTSPGIRMPGGVLPLDVAFARIDPDEPVSEVAPFDLLGTFAFVSTSNGLVIVVNVDDDSYPDVEDPEDPIRVDLVLALPHQVRDEGRDRDEQTEACALPEADPRSLGPRLADVPVRSVSSDAIAETKLGQLPSLRAVECDPLADDVAPVAVPELAFAAPADVREASYPDVGVTRSESWLLSWEGPLSIDSATVEVDGPAIRRGVVAGNRVRDPSGSLCDSGVERFDVVSLVGCDPAVGASQCGVGETCYVHPDSPASVTTGQCLPTDAIDELSGVCKGFLTGERRYSVRKATSGELTIGLRRRVLRTSPLDGCVSADQCEAMAAVDAALLDERHPGEIEAPGVPEDAATWECGADPTRAAGVPRCMMTCETTDDCTPGTLCDGGYCVEGVLPPARCVSTVQRFQLRVGDAFALLGERTGFLHRNVRDPDSGECVADPTASPLLVSRVPLRPPPCTDGPDSPDPCATVVAQTEAFVPYVLEGGECRPGDEVLRTRQAPAVRIENPVLRMHLVDLETQGDAACIGDGAGEAPAYSAVFRGFAISFDVVGGVAPMSVPEIAAALPARMVTSPDGRVWVIDEGDDVLPITAGRIYTFEPANASGGFVSGQPIL